MYIFTFYIFTVFHIILHCMASRTYYIPESVIFRKTKESFGGLSNMAAGYHIFVNDIIIPSSEHLYQACKFPYHTELQWEIVHEPNPMKAKWISRANDGLVRPDWDNVRFKVMQWAIEIKLSQNSQTFGALLLSTGDKPIVEATPKDKIWGAVKDGDYYVGVNALGRILMQVRETYVKTGQIPSCVNPLDIPNFNFLGHQIERICCDTAFADLYSNEAETLYTH